MEKNTGIRELEILEAGDLMIILGIGKNSAYKLMKSPDFPSKKIGGLWKVSRNAFEDWLNNQSKK